MSRESDMQEKYSEIILTQEQIDKIKKKFGGRHKKSIFEQAIDEYLESMEDEG
jgi:predicted DNA-binding protein